MREDDFTIIDDGSAASVPVTLEKDQIRLEPADLKRALRWELQSEGFCRDGTCVPVPEGTSVVTDAGVDLVEFAHLIDRPLAVDAQERAAYLGTSAVDRGEALTALTAPDFTLPDVEGKLHSLSDYRGKKILLVAYASW